ncbi:MAG: hypothetical protein ACUVV4_03775 [Candidatus Bathyarchaeia archaeon]
MGIKTSIILGLLISGAFPFATVYLWQYRSWEAYSREGSVIDAIIFLKKSPTFKFDGIPDSIKVIGVETLKMPWTWEVKISFDCRNAGYGDRTGKIVLPVITPHEISIVVSKGRVIRAIIDGRWDEIQQRFTSL